MHQQLDELLLRCSSLASTGGYHCIGVQCRDRCAEMREGGEAFYRLLGTARELCAQALTRARSGTTRQLAMFASHAHLTWEAVLLAALWHKQPEAVNNVLDLCLAQRKNCRCGSAKLDVKPCRRIFFVAIERTHQLCSRYREAVGVFGARLRRAQHWVFLPCFTIRRCLAKNSAARDRVGGQLSKPVPLVDDVGVGIQHQHAIKDGLAQQDGLVERVRVRLGQRLEEVRLQEWKVQPLQALRRSPSGRVASICAQRGEAE
mmetsp:Transcript_34814/g.57573  ORF Transcript_34814/g.57573 Transcript_34814/m.57573 type:complete len:260 (-) Transcript_34814:776-1555(-)